MYKLKNYIQTIEFLIHLFKYSITDDALKISQYIWSVIFYRTMFKTQLLKI